LAEIADLTGSTIFGNGDSDSFLVGIKSAKAVFFSTAGVTFMMVCLPVIESL
jgi:hypothetical protein